MAQNFAAGLAEETSDNNDNGIRKAQNGLLKLGRKNPEEVRIIPYVDRKFWFPYRVCWVDLHNKDNTKTFSAMLTFPYKDDGNDKLRTLIAKMIKINYKYRKDNPAYKKDIIQLQFPHNGHTPFYASLRPMFALQAIKIVKGADGSDTENTFSGTTLPMPQIMNVSKTVMSDISTSILSKDNKELMGFACTNSKDKKYNGKPYPLKLTVPNEMRWINTDVSFPVFIHLDKKNTYHVDPQLFNLQPPLPPELYAKDKKGNYKHLDDPAYMYEPTKTRQPTIYKMALDQLTQRYDEYKEGNHNAFDDQVKRVKANTEGNQEQSDTQGKPEDQQNSAGSNPFASTGSSFSNDKESSSSNEDSAQAFDPNIIANNVTGSNSSSDIPSNNTPGSQSNSTNPSANSTPVSSESATGNSIGHTSVEDSDSQNSEESSKAPSQPSEDSGEKVNIDGKQIDLSQYPPSIRKIIENNMKNK